jgi:16S rRNA (guanine966-N2)-methyltransferase
MAASYIRLGDFSLGEAEKGNDGMRVTGGKLGGRRLVAPDDARVRPTSDRTRQAIFNILEHRDFGIGFTLENAAVADLFAGTGALGLEALSRGARFCLLVDDSAESRALQRENIEALGLTGATKIWRRDATAVGPLGAGAGGPFDLVFLDPPYRKNLIAPTLKSLRDGGWLAARALLIAETSKGENFDHGGYEKLDARDYGETEICFLTPSE